VSGKATTTTTCLTEGIEDTIFKYSNVSATPVMTLINTVYLAWMSDEITTLRP